MGAYIPSVDEIRRLTAGDRTVLAPSEIHQREIERGKSGEKTLLEAQRATRLAAEANRRVEAEITRMRTRGRETPMELRAALNELFKNYDFSPAEELVRMLMDRAYEYHVKDLGLRKAILCELQQYVMPKLKSTEITGRIDHAHTIVIQRYGEDGSVTRTDPVIAPRPTVSLATHACGDGETSGSESRPPGSESRPPGSEKRTIDV